MGSDKWVLPEVRSGSGRPCSRPPFVLYAAEELTSNGCGDIERDRMNAASTLFGHKKVDAVAYRKTPLLDRFLSFKTIGDGGWTIH